MLLHSVDERPVRLLVHVGWARRFWCFAEVPLLPVFVEFHVNPAKFSFVLLPIHAFHNHLQVANPRITTLIAYCRHQQTEQAHLTQVLFHLHLLADAPELGILPLARLSRFLLAVLWVGTI